VPRRVSSVEFAGRGPQLAALSDALDRAAAGEFAAVFLAGESGVGKSRLLLELERAAESSGARVIGGDCVGSPRENCPTRRSRPSSVNSRANSTRTNSMTFSRLRARSSRGSCRSSVRPATPSGASRSLACRSRSRGCSTCSCPCFDRLGADAPVVLAIEDIHWADRSTRDFLGFLVGNARRERLLLVCTYRTDELHRRHPLRPFLAQHERRPSVERVELRAFSLAELTAQLHGILDAPPDPALVRRLHERTGGNAFFTEELLAASADGAQLPDSLRDALMLRIEVLSEQAQAVLRMAAAHGPLVPHRLLAAVCDLDETELLAAVREAVTHHVLVQRDEETYAVRHALLQETLEADLLPGERTSLHLALA
jgi:predicted ATPase